MDIERKEFIKALKTHKGKLSLLMNSMKIDSKNVLASEKLRQQGNILLQKDSHSNEDHDNILQMCNKSIALAPEKTEELALAYEVRSAFLFHLRKYDESITDIDRAMNISKSDVLKIKLLCRKVNCMSELRLFVDHTLLDEIQSLLDAIPENDVNKKVLTETFGKTKALKQSTKKIQDTKTIDPLADLNDKEDIFKSVAVKFDEKYGRYLEATRDFSPGEVIYVDKFYAACLNYEKIYSHCHHCLNICWSVIPCVNCSWAMFCSEKCKREASEGYHDIECSVIPNVKTITQPIFWNVHLSIRLLVMALKEAGSIEKLKKDLKIMDKLDPSYLTESGVENKFTNLYTLSSNVTQSDSFGYSIISTDVLSLLAKNTPFFFKDFKNVKTEDLANNQDYIFIGSLFIKLLKIGQVNSHLLSKIDNSIKSNEAEDCKGAGLALITSLINHSCVPNTGRAFTKDKRIIVYAIQPIKKGSQLFDTYSGWFNEIPDKIQRQNNLKQYQFTCDCDACKNNWKLKTDFYSEKKSREEIKLFEKIVRIRHLLPSGNEKYDQEIIKLTSEAIIQATQCLPPMSETRIELYRMLIYIFDKMYSYEGNLHISCTK